MGCDWRLRIWVVLTTLNIKKVLSLLTKNQHVGLWYKKFYNNYIRVLINKFTLDGLVSHVTFISMGKTENNEYEIECASDLVEL